MTRRDTVHELAETLAICCANDTIADLMDATLSADDNYALDDYQADLAEAFFDSLCELRPDCIKLAQERGRRLEHHPTAGTARMLGYALLSSIILWGLIVLATVLL